jgi:diguanylate cyclase (GGDEF)-like protein/PAS domain S-box-containing protein
MTRETILIVDDSRDIADYLGGSVLPSLGYQTLVAYNGKDAFEIVKNHGRQLSLMLLDLQLPDTTGLDFLRRLNRVGYSIPVILVTAHGSEQVAVDAFRLGVEDYLTKPVDVEMLGEAITRALTESRLRREKARLTTELQEQVSWLTALLNIGRSITSSLDINTVLRRIVEAGVHLTRADQGFLALMEEDSDRLYLRAVKNIDQAKIDTLRIPVQDSLVGEVLRQGRPIRRTQETSDGPLKVTTGFLVHSLMHVPLLFGGKALGVLSVNNHTSKRSFSERDEAMLVSLADYAATSLENANLYQHARLEITERRRVEEALRDSEERYALAVRGANDGVWDWDLKSNQIYYSPRWKAMLGYDDGAIGSSPNEWFSRVHPDDLERTKLDISAHIRGHASHFINEHRVKHSDGSYRWVLSRGLAVWDPKGVAVRIAGSFSDITDRKEAEERLIHDAFHDMLTGLPNRALFMDRLERAVERAKRREDYRFAVLFLDLDHFKDVNDSMGHLVGDQMLIKVGELLNKGLRASDTLARFGGDEFIILLEDLNDVKGVSRVTNWILQTLSSPIEIKGRDIFTTASIGVVVNITKYDRADDIVRDADIAMYVAKSRGRARAEIFDRSMRDRIMDRLTLESDLRQALEENQLCSHYQPIVLIETGQLVGFESLIRWHHPKRGLLLPADFLPLAEETGMVMAIDRWVMRSSCQKMKDWQKRYTLNPMVTISVNVSGKHLAENDLATYVGRVMKESGLDSKFLKIEITERSIVDFNDVTTTIFSELQKLGVQIQIDDFGTGYSSLGYLTRFQIDALKIDQSFVQNIVDDSNQREVIQAIVNLTKRLHVKVIAEGVETAEQVEHLRELGCVLAQGIWFSPPLEADQVTEILNQLDAEGNYYFTRE